MDSYFKVIQWVGLADIKGKIALSIVPFSKITLLDEITWI